jgi:3-oxoacyl-[acyl-carrier-protein] synthase III
MNRVLLIGAENSVLGHQLGGSDHAFLFGDGAGAVVVEACPATGGCWVGILGWTARSYP